ncbi:MAG TPA: hypothetical protein VLM37_01670 [Fibrobacteraceae bacterium]|nr:hypothetical protein [Fibrobacteraceae bacterium]
MNGITNTGQPSLYLSNPYASTLSISLARLTTGLSVKTEQDNGKTVAQTQKLNQLAHESARTASDLDEHIHRLETAEDALDSMKGMLERMSELARQASQTTDSESRASLGEEFDALRNAVGAVVQCTRYEGEQLLTGLFDSSATVSGVPGEPNLVQIGEDGDSFFYELLDSRVQSDDASDGSDVYHGLNLGTDSAQESWGSSSDGKEAANEDYRRVSGKEDSGLARLQRNQTRISTNLAGISSAKARLENKESNYMAAASAMARMGNAEEISRSLSLQIRQGGSSSIFAQSNVSYGSVIGLLAGYPSAR